MTTQTSLKHQAMKTFFSYWPAEGQDFTVTCGPAGLCSKIKLRYELGGANYMSGQTNSRGIYLHFSLVTVTNRDGYRMEEYMLFADTSYKILIAPLARKSQSIIDRAGDICALYDTQLHEAHIAKDKPALFAIIDKIRENFKQS